MKHIKTLRIDIDKKNFEVIPSVQYDSNTRFLHIYLLNNSMAFDITGCSVKISGTKLDGTAIFNNCTVINAKEGFVEVELTEQMNAVPGTLNCELKLYSGNGVLTTKPFYIEVTASVTSKTITSSNEFKALTETLKEVQRFENRIDEIANKGTTTEVLKKTTEDYIQEKLEDGTIANLTLADGSVTKEKLDPNIKFGIEDGEVTIEKLEFMNYKYINLFNPNDQDFGQGQILSNGSYNTSTTVHHSGYIAVIPGEKIYYSSGYKTDLTNNNFIQGYNKDKQIVSGAIPASTKTTQVENDQYSRYFIVPDDIYYIRFGYLYNYNSLYQDFIVSREYHSYTEKIHYGDYENIDFNISEQWKPYIFQSLIKGEKIGSENIEGSINRKIENANNAISYLSPNVVKRRIVDEIKYDSIRSDVALLGNLFIQEDKYNSWMLHNNFFDKDIDKVVFFYNARESHYGGTGTVKWRTLDKNDPRIVSESNIACKSTDVDGQTALTNGMVTCSCTVLNDGSWMILAKNHSAASNGIDKITTIEVYKSTDKGETWSNWSMKDVEGENIVPNVGGSYGLIQSKSGRIFTINYYTNQVRVYYSDDNGTTWEYSVIANKTSYANDKLYFGASIVNLDGVLMIIQRVNIREAGIPAVISYSKDDGETWSDFVDSNTIINAGGSPVCAIAHDGVVEILYGERVAREGESGGRIYHTAATYKDALEDNFLPPKIIGYSNNNGDNFGYFGGCSDNNGGIHVFYYDDNVIKSEALGCNIRYIKGSFNKKLNLIDMSNSNIKEGSSKVVDQGISNYRIIPTSSDNNENCIASITINSGNLLDIEKDFTEYYEYQKFGSIPSNTKSINDYYGNIFQFKQALFYGYDCYGQKVKVQPFTDYIVSVPICYQPENLTQGVVIYGNNSFIDYKTLDESKYKNDMCIIFNSKANDEVLISYVNKASNIQYTMQVVNPAMNIYKGHSFIENNRKTTNLIFEDYQLRYISDVIKDKIENGVYIKQVETMLIDGQNINFDSYSLATTSNSKPYVKWNNRITKPQYYGTFGSGTSNLVHIACNNSDVVCASYSESKDSIIDNDKISMSLALTYNAPAIGLPFSLLEGVTESSSTADVQAAIRTYFSNNPITVYVPCPEIRTPINYSPLVLNVDSIVTNDGEGTIVEII